MKFMAMSEVCLKVWDRLVLLCIRSKSVIFCVV